MENQLIVLLQEMPEYIVLGDICLYFVIWGFGFYVSLCIFIIINKNWRGDSHIAWLGSKCFKKNVQVILFAWKIGIKAFYHFHKVHQLKTLRSTQAKLWILAIQIYRVLVQSKKHPSINWSRSTTVDQEISLGYAYLSWSKVCKIVV